MASNARHFDMTLAVCRLIHTWSLIRKHGHLHIFTEHAYICDHAQSEQNTFLPDFSKEVQENDFDDIDIKIHDRYLQLCFTPLNATNTYINKCVRYTAHSGRQA